MTPPGLTTVVKCVAVLQPNHLTLFLDNSLEFMERRPRNSERRVVGGRTHPTESVESVVHIQSQVRLNITGVAHSIQTTGVARSIQTMTSFHHLLPHFSSLFIPNQGDILSSWRRFRLSRLRFQAFDLFADIQTDLLALAVMISDNCRVL